MNKEVNAEKVPKSWRRYYLKVFKRGLCPSFKNKPLSPIRWSVELVEILKYTFQLIAVVWGIACIYIGLKSEGAERILFLGCGIAILGVALLAELM